LRVYRVCFKHDDLAKSFEPNLFERVCVHKIWMPTMEEKNGISFNCTESALIQVNREYPLSAFNESCMKIASVFGGGIGGTGNVCGAVSGAAMCLGMALGTTGNEPSEEFKETREKVRELVKEVIFKFTNAWGTVCCEHLKAMDEGKEKLVGTKRQNQQPEQKMCGEYVAWASDMVIRLLKEAKD
jgi:C_GCAxxG_C_C family probable redox protein